MRSISGKSALVSLSFLVLLTAAALVPAVELAVAGGSTPTRAQLGLMVSTAESSRAYAAGLVAFGASHGVTSTDANAALSSGDALLASAQTELSSGANLAGGISDAQGAMSSYSSAAADASLSLEQHGLTGSVDVDAVAGSVALVNSTIEAMVRAQASACASVGASSNSTLVAACAAASSAVSNAALDLKAAVSALARINAGASESVALPGASASLASAKEELGNASMYIQVASAYGYSARGSAFRTSVLDSLSASANSSIRAEAAALASIDGVGQSLGANMNALASANGDLSTLSTNVLATKFESLSASVSSSQSTAVEVDSTMSSFLTLLNGLALTGDAPLIASISACQSSTTSYSGSLTPELSASADFGASSATSYDTYLTSYQAEAQSALTAQGLYVASFRSVQSNLSAFIKTLIVVPPQLVTENTTLAALGGGVVSTTEDLSGKLQTQVTALGKVEADLGAVKQAFITDSSGLDVSVSLLTVIEGTYQNVSAFVGPQGYAAVSTAATGISSSANATSSFLAAVQSALSGSVSQLNSSTTTLLAAGAAAQVSENSTASSLAHASAVVSAALTSRESESSSGRLLVYQALRLFSAQDVSAGVASMDEAQFLFYEASATYTA
ncbi:MAG TPA: hypothetical protein VFE91_02925 [Nitrososphaerales archaeon]|nr:hypothetical protein [Nitrososphaerales archaeon]